MKLERITIENFRRIQNTEVIFDKAAFIIGPNNHGKTSIIDAIDALLSLKSDKITEHDFRLDLDGTTPSDKIIIIGTFCDISDETRKSRGFKGRVVDDKFTYKKTFTLTRGPEKVKIDTKVEALAYNVTVKEDSKSIKTYQDLTNKGLSETDIFAIFSKVPSQFNEKLPKNWEYQVEETLDYNYSSTPEFQDNPGGIPQNVLSKLPKVIRVPSLVDLGDLEAKEKGSGILSECLKLLFDEILSGNELADAIQSQLSALQESMHPKTEGSQLQDLTNNVNRMVESVFPSCGISISPNLQNISEILKPKYDISIFSNVSTRVEKQGTGLIRTMVFSMLRYNSMLRATKKKETRAIIVAFEEPETYLHPSAANLLRETIYEIGLSDQIICSTHSPWMIDLTKDPISLTKMQLSEDNSSVQSINYGLRSTLLKLDEEDKSRLKMLKAFDDEVSRVFFAERIVIVEGDTETAVINNTLKLLSDTQRRDILYRTHIVKARGKATIISLVKYLQDLDIRPYVLHDSDIKTDGAKKFNLPIAEAVGDPNRVRTNNNCIEDTLGYEAPSSDKPYRAYHESRKWKSISDVPDAWWENFCFLFGLDPKMNREREQI